MLSDLTQIVINIVNYLGYEGIFLLMVIESSFIPFPSEIVLIPAGYLAHQGKMDPFLVVLSGVLGSLIGAYINYFLSLKLGRAFIIKYGRYFFLPNDKFQALERAFNKHGSFATFVGRLIFGIRQWISIPAGLAKMDIKKFSLYTAFGASIWVIILVSLGYILGEGKETEKLAKQVGYWLLGVVIIMTLAYYYWQKGNNNKGSKTCLK